MRKQLETFYHFYCPANMHLSQVGWWLDQQLQTIVKARLHDHSKITICFTMPTQLQDFYGIPYKDNTFYNHCTFQQKILEYLEFRYPFVRIGPVRDVNEPNIYEGSTLKLVHQKSIEKDCYILYFHNKGMVSNSFQVGTWRETLNHFLIEKWRDCVQMLDDGFDLVGVKDRFLPTSANFFWADNCYLQNLEDPLRTDLYCPPEKSEMWPGQSAYRYGFELWCLSGKPVIGQIHETGVCHFSNYYLKEWVDS